jgi:hypothetical protein
MNLHKIQEAVEYDRSARQILAIHTTDPEQRAALDRAARRERKLALKALFEAFDGEQR